MEGWKEDLIHKKEEEGGRKERWPLERRKGRRPGKKKQLFGRKGAKVASLTDGLGPQKNEMHRESNDRIAQARKWGERDSKKKKEL